MAIQALVGASLATLGAAGQAFGSYMGGQSKAEAAAEQRKAIERSLAQTSQAFDYASRLEAQQSAAAASRAEQAGAKALMLAQQQTQQQIYDAYASPAMGAYAGYLADMFTRGIPEITAREYAGRLRTAQAARGTAYGGASVRDEAALLTGLAEQGRQALLPQLQQFALQPLALQQSGVAANLGAQQAALGVGFTPYTAGLQGRQVASQIAAQQLQLGQLGLTGSTSMPFASDPGLAAYLASGFGALAGQAGGALLGGVNPFAAAAPPPQAVQPRRPVYM